MYTYYIRSALALELWNQSVSWKTIMQSDPIIPKSWTVDSKYTDWFNAIRYVSLYKVEEKGENGLKEI